MKVTVERDKITDEISQIFDYEFDGTSTFHPHEINSLDRETVLSDFGIGLIVGPSGSGKTTLLKEFGEEYEPYWFDNKSIASHFDDIDDVQDRLGAVGFNSVPSWMRPYHVLSNGEQFRARLARQLDSNIVVDEFTSVIDRDVAKSCSNAISRYVKRHNLKNIVFSSCHYDIIEWLQPDWVFDTQTGKLTTRGYQRPDIVLEILPCTRDIWTHFSDHHYLDHNIHKGASCWIATWNGRLVGFLSSLSMPSGSLKNAWRAHRVVILPEFQGLGIGARLMDALGDMHVAEGKRFFLKTSHPRLGEYCNRNDAWKGTSKNGIARPDYKTNSSTYGGFAEGLQKHMNRICYSHEYIGK
jgi:energy-coupling factor transporter ATP-binding protein EcfA2